MQTPISATRRGLRREAGSCRKHSLSLQLYLRRLMSSFAIFKFVTANTVNVTIENNTAASITPTAFTLNARVTR